MNSLAKHFWPSLLFDLAHTSETEWGRPFFSNAHRNEEEDEPFTACQMMGVGIEVSGIFFFCKVARIVGNGDFWSEKSKIGIAKVLVDDTY